MQNMYHPLVNRLSRALGSPTPWVFLFGAIAAGLLGEGASKWVDAWLADESVITAVYTLLLGFLILLLIVVLFNVPDWLRTTFFSDRQATVTVTEHVPHYRALIALVSQGPYVPAQNALEYHSWSGIPGQKPTLTHCWLLAGPGTGELSSQSNADKLAETFHVQGVEVEVWPLEDADNIEEVFRAVKTIYEVARNKVNLSPDDIILDYTGGTKSMTAGLILAALEQGSRLQYMKPNRYETDGRADRAAGSNPRLVQVNFVSVAEVD